MGPSLPQRLSSAGELYIQTSCVSRRQNLCSRMRFVFVLCVICASAACDDGAHYTHIARGIHNSMASGLSETCAPTNHDEI